MDGLNILENDLLEWRDCDGGASVIHRVLRIVPDTEHVVLIAVAVLSEETANSRSQLVQDRRAMPRWVPFGQLADAMTAGAVITRSEDPFFADTRPDEEVSDASRARRDERWQVIAPLVEPAQGDGLDILRTETRGPLVRGAAIATGRAKDKIYDWLRLYWQHGQSRNALLGAYHRSGAPGKPRAAGKAKRGRRNCLAKEHPELAGINVTEPIRLLLVQGGKRFYEKQGLSLKDAYQHTMECFFRLRLHLKDGALVPILAPAHQRPTFRQFCWWYGKARDLERELKARYGERRFALRHRVVTGTSEHLSKGPGDVFLIDATVGDIYLISSLDPTRVIGRPVIYLVMDHWSHMIVGLYVGLEGPSWMGAQLALFNAFSDKVEFCRRYGINISPADWPSAHVPRWVLADRGPEFLGAPSEQLVIFFRVGVKNVPPWRADFKSLVEGQFNVTNEMGIHWEPGAVHGPRERGERDIRLDAVHTIESFTRLMIELTLWHNKSRPLGDTVPVGVPLPPDGDPAPIDLWEWGIENRMGLLRRVSSARARIDLLPTSPASVTDRGIYVHDLRLHYTSQDPRVQTMLLRNTGRHWPELSSSYERRDVSQAYLRLDRGRTLAELVLAGADRRYARMTWEEVADFRACRSVARALGRSAQAQSLAELHARLEANRTDRQRAREDALGPHGQPDVVNIRDARRGMRREERANEAARWNGGESPAPGPKPPGGDNYIPYPD